MIETDSLSITVVATGAELPGVTGCTIRHDEGATPYTTGQITMKLPAPSLLAQLDHRDRPALIITASRRLPDSADAQGSPRSSTTLTLRVTDRSIDLEAATLTLTLGNAETFLDFAPTEDIDYRYYSFDIYPAIRDVLNRSIPGGLTTTFSGPMTPFVPAFTARNLVPEGGFEWPLTGRWRGVNIETPTIVRGFNRQGSNSMRLKANAVSPDSYVEIDAGFTPGKTYRVSAWGMTDSTFSNQAMPGRAQKLCIVADPRGFPEIIAISPDGQPAFNATTPVERVVEFTMPENVKDSALRLYNGTDGPSNGAVYWDAVSAIESPYTDRPNVPIAYFDGDTADDDRYVYTWDATPGVSSSTRTPRVERLPDLLVWHRGQTARDFIRGLTQALGLRLFQHVDGFWRLADNTYRETQYPSLVRVDQMDNLYQGTEQGGFNDTASDGSPLWADAVSITYRWLDGNGVTQERTDTYAPTGYRKLYSLTVESQYPGPGQAAYLQSRLVMRARQMRLSARPDLRILPSQELTVSAPHAPGLLTGLVDSVVFDLTNAEMAVTGKALVDTPTTAWNQLPTGVAWSASPVGASWASETA